MSTKTLSSNDDPAAFDSPKWKIRFVDVAGVAMALPSALGVLCVLARANLSVLSLAAISILFLVCLISSLGGILISFWMRSPLLAWGVRFTGVAWLGVCGFIAVTFVLQLAGFSGR